MPFKRVLTSDFSFKGLAFFIFLTATFMNYWTISKEQSNPRIPLYLSEFRSPPRFLDYLQTASLLISFALLLANALSARVWRKSHRFLILTLLIIFQLIPFWSSGRRNLVFSCFCGVLLAIAHVLSKRKDFGNLRISLSKLIFVLSITFVSITATSLGRGLALDKDVIPPTVQSQEENETSYVESKTRIAVQSLSDGAAFRDWSGRGEILDGHFSLYALIKIGHRPSLTGEKTYTRYAKLLGIEERSKGYTINPIAAYFMNLGVLGVLIWSFVMAFLLSILLAVTKLQKEGVASNVYTVLLAFLSWPILAITTSRGGPESMWGLLLHLFILPILFIIPFRIRPRLSL